MSQPDRENGSRAHPEIDRRALLKTCLLAAVSPLSGGAAGPDRLLGGFHAPIHHTASGRESAEGAVSVRDLANYIDFERAPKRLRGNGPPGNPDRGTVDPDDKVTYYLPWNPVESENDATPRSWVRYVLSEVGRTNDYAYDMGMINRTEDLAAVDNGDLTQKGLIEAHRWRGDERERGDHRSLQAVARRHRQGTTHTCLWLNTKLLSLPTYNTNNREARAKAIGEALGRADYDVVGMSEVDRKKTADWIRSRFHTHTTAGSVDATFGPDEHTRPNNPIDTSGLFSMVAVDPTRSIGETGDGDVGTHHYNRRGSVAKQALWLGFQHVPVSTPEGGFDYFFTHLFPGNPDANNDVRKDQLDELVSAIEERNAEKGEWPTVVAGDMNLHSSKPDEYRPLTRKLGSVGLQDLRLTRGGPWMDTLTDLSQWNLKSPSPGDEPGNGVGACYADDFWEPGDPDQRLDYVFVSRPKPEHDTRLDIRRVWRVPLHHSCRGNPADGSDTTEKRSRLTDHVGLGFEILTSTYD